MKPNAHASHSKEICADQEVGCTNGQTPHTRIVVDFSTISFRFVFWEETCANFNIRSHRVLLYRPMVLMRVPTSDGVSLISFALIFYNKRYGKFKQNLRLMLPVNDKPHSC